MNENLGCNFYLATHPKLSVNMLWASYLQAGIWAIK